METMTTLATNLDVSLDDRIAASKTGTRSRRGAGVGGPQRSEHRKGRSGAQRMKELAPYKRGDSDSAWKHDLYGKSEGIQGGVLGARMVTSPNSGSSGPRGRVDLSGVKGFLSAAQQEAGKKGMSLKGAGTGGGKTTVKVENLMEGTTAADVEAIFKAVGQISSAKQTKFRPTVTVEIVYKTSESALQAVKQYDGQYADGQELHVSVVDRPGGTSIAGAANGNDALLGRLGISSKKTGDLLDDGDTGSGMRSDALLDDPRAQVVTMDAVDRGNGRERRSGKRRGGR